MRIARHNTEAGRSPYHGVEFRAFPRVFAHDDCPACTRAERACPDIQVPADWPDEIAAAFEHTAARHHGLPPHITRDADEDLPAWLYPAAMNAPGDRTVGETSATQVFDRIAGALTCLGWQLGYFDAEADAHAFSDELRYAMCRRLLLPGEPELRSAGLAWAYGIGGGADGMFAIDPRTGKVGLAGPVCVPPHGSEAAATHVAPVNDGLMALAFGDNAQRVRALPMWRRIVDGAWRAGHAAVTFGGMAPGLSHVLTEEGAVTREDAGLFTFAIDLAAFVRNGEFAAGHFAQIVRLATIAGDLALLLRAHSSRRGAAAAWAFRPLGLRLGGLAPALMAQGIAYDSAEGRAAATAAFALFTGTAFATSAALAAELGACPGFTPNRNAILATAARRRRLISGVSARNGIPAAQRFDIGACDPALAQAALSAWSDAMIGIERHGLRNTALTNGAELAPLRALTRFERQAGGGFGSRVEPAVAHGLATLGYGEAAIGLALAQLAGRGTLKDAPAINHDTLRQRGFTEAALAAMEAALGTALHIRFAFNRWTLGYEFCVSGLGLGPEQIDGDMLAALGFADAEISAANCHALGGQSLADAPIDPAHKAVFGGADTRAHVRMLAAVQPFVCAPLDETVALGAGGVEECGQALALAWRLGLPGLTFQRAGATAIPAMEIPRQPAETIRPREAIRLLTANETTRRSAMDAVRGATSASGNADVVVQ